MRNLDQKMKNLKLKLNKILLFESFVNKLNIIYKDNDIEIYVPKNLNSSIKVSDRQWCTTSKQGFYSHNLTANLYRIIFKDGYKLRLTWDFFDIEKTHWGQGGNINGDKANYHVIRSEDIKNPFNIENTYPKYTDTMYNRIKSLPQNAINSILKYQENTKEKNALYLNMYKEINKIDVINVKKAKHNDIYALDVTVRYNNREYIINFLEGYYRIFSSGLERDFKNKYALSERDSIEYYLNYKCLSWLQKNNYNEYKNFKAYIEK